MRHLNNGTDHRHSKSRCDQSSPARRTINVCQLRFSEQVPIYPPSHRDNRCVHYGDVIMGTIASQFTSLAIVFSTVYLDTDQRKHQSSASLAFVRGIHRRPVNSLHKGPVTRKMFPFDDVIMDAMVPSLRVEDPSPSLCDPSQFSPHFELWPITFHRLGVQVRTHESQGKFPRNLNCDLLSNP